MTEQSTTISSEETGPLFKLESVSFSVADRTLLHPLTLAMPEKRVVGLIGHNGSGKSTLLKILARQQPPGGGAVQFKGRPLNEWSSREFARKLAYLPQTTFNAPGMLVRELVALGRYPWHGALGRFGAIDRAKVEEAMSLANIIGMADRQVDTLSGGERQRVCLAMLVAQDADCLLLDEPTSALDITHQIEVLSLIRTLSRAKGVGVVIVLHDVNMASRFCDEILALHSGRLIARGTPAEIVTSAQMRRIYGLDMDVLPHPASGMPIAVPR